MILNIDSFSKSNWSVGETPFRFGKIEKLQTQNNQHEKKKRKNFCKSNNAIKQQSIEMQQNNHPSHLEFFSISNFILRCCNRIYNFFQMQKNINTYPIESLVWKMPFHAVMEMTLSN